MGNCLVTKLKAAVNNPDLPKLTDYTFDILVNSALTPAQLASRLRVAGTNVSVDVNDAKTKATIHNIQNLTEFQSYEGVGVGLDLNALCKGGIITKININQSTGTTPEYHITGDVTKLPTTLISVVFPDLEFDIKDIGHLTSLFALSFATNITDSVFANMSGSVEEFVQAQIAAGKTSNQVGVLYGLNGAFTIPIRGSVTFNGNVLTGNAKRIKWNWDGSSANITVADA